MNINCLRDDVCSLDRARRRLESELKEKREELRRLTQQHRFETNKHTQWVKGAVIMLCRWNGDADGVRQWCRASGSTTDFINDVVNTAQTKVSEFSAADKEQCKTNEAMPKCCLTKKAAKLVEEYTLYQWVRQQNLNKGVAPGRKSFLHQRQLQVPEHAIRKKDLSAASGKQWCRRWRSRWNVSLGRFGNRETIPAAEAQSKAFALHLFKVSQGLGGFFGNI